MTPPLTTFTNVTPPDAGGFLAWFGDTSFPDGSADAPTLSQATFEATYGRLLGAARAPGLMPWLFQLEAPLVAIRPDAPVPVAVVDLPVAMADAAEARALAERAFAARAHGDRTTVTDIAAALAPNATRGRAFFAAALMHEQWAQDAPVFRGRDVTFTLDERFWVALPGAPRPDALELDPGDGGGPRPVSLAPASAGVAQVRASYAASVSEATVTLRARYGDETRTARFTLLVGGPAAAPAPDESWPLSGDVPDEPPATGRASVWLGAGNAAVRSPIVIAEGFPGGYAPDYMYDTLNQSGLADTLRARGYDLVVVHYDKGSDPIQRSARVVIACVAELHRRGAPPHVVGGVSMGGLVARYALLRMERDGVVPGGGTPAHAGAHGAHTFLTIDTPHLGAYTAIGDQWLAQFLAPVSPLAATLAGALATPANQQFVMRVLDGDRVAPSDLRTALLAELKELGDWPDTVRRLGVSSGSGAGATDAGVTKRKAHRPALALDGAPFAELRLHTLPSDGETAVVAEGRSAVPAPGVPESLEVTSDIAWDDVPGGTNQYTAMAAGIAHALACGNVTCHEPVCCSVPTVSALALDQDPRSPVPDPASGRSPFHDYACADRDTHHCTITPGVAAWLLDRLGAPGTPNDVRPSPQRDADMATTAQPAGAYTNVTPAQPGAVTSAQPEAAAAALPSLDDAKTNHHDPAYLADPYPTYARLRADAPAAERPPYPGLWITRYADVTAALADPATFRKKPVHGAPALPGVLGALDAMPSGVFSADAPFHEQIRAVVEPPLRQAFRGAAQVVDAITDDILGKIVASRTRRMELMADYALKVPSGTLFTLLGLPEQDWPQVVALVSLVAAANDITQSRGVQTMGGMAAMALTAYCQGTLRRVAKSSEDSVLKQMLDSANATGLTADDVQESLFNLLVAGYLSTTFLIGTGVLNLLDPRNAEQLAALRRDPSLIDNAVQEMLRHDAPAQIVDRVTSREVTLGDTTLPANTAVKLVLGSANRDEAKFENADRFDITRPNVKEEAIPFGVGAHTCIGAPLVAIVAPIAIGKLVATFPAMKVDGYVAWTTDPYLRSPANVPLAI